MADEDGGTDYLFKILVVGEQGTGKTSIIKRYVHNIYSVHYKATIGVDFALKVINWDDNSVVRLQLWDIAGQERFGNMTRVYYKEAVGAFVVFDITRLETFDEVKKWKADIDSKVFLGTGPDRKPIPVVLLANKVDLDTSEEGFETNNKAKLDKFCQEFGFINWFATSAKKGVNIDKAAKFLVEDILAHHKEHHQAKEADPDVVDIRKTGGTPKKEESGGCCS
jgi:small GTP-binding protein